MLGWIRINFAFKPVPPTRLYNRVWVWEVRRVATSAACWSLFHQLSQLMGQTHRRTDACSRTSARAPGKRRWKVMPGLRMLSGVVLSARPVYCSFGMWIGCGGVSVCAWFFFLFLLVTLKLLVSHWFFFWQTRTELSERNHITVAHRYGAIL